MSDPIYLGIDIESHVSIGGGGWSDIDIVIDGKKHTIRAIATGNLARRILDIRLRKNGGGHKQKPVAKKDLE